VIKDSAGKKKYANQWFSIVWNLKKKEVLEFVMFGSI